MKNPAGLAPAPPTRSITFFCWILNKSEQSFSVDIDDDRTVDHLKKAIVKEKPMAFADVGADELKLWKVRLSAFAHLQIS